jgi:hypothetical protein
MKVYQPTVLNTLAPYAGPQGFGMDKMTGQTIDQQTTAGSNQIDPTPFRGYSVPAPSLRYYGLSEMRPKGRTGRPTIPGGQMIMTTTGSTRPTSIPVMTTPAITTPANVETVIYTPDQAKPWYKSPLYFALLAAGAFWLAKKYKIV